MADWVIDIEGNGLLPTISKIWCIVAQHIHDDERTILFTDDTDSYEDYKVHPLRRFKQFIHKGKVDKIVGHNILTYDLPVLRKILGLTYTVLPDTLDGHGLEFVDTLVWSQHLFTNLQLPKGCPTTYKAILPDGSEESRPVGPHSLAAYGYRVGISKPSVEDWRNQPIKVYLNRCIEDTKINSAMYKKYFERFLK